MWFEIIPSMLIIGMIPIVPQMFAYYLNQYTLGNPMRRDMTEVWDRHMFTRDIRTGGAPWKHKGLGAIPDD